MPSVLPASEIKNFFLDEKTHLAYHLLYTDGQIRANAIGITEVMYKDRGAADLWYERIADVIGAGTAMAKLNEIHDDMLKTAV